MSAISGAARAAATSDAGPAPGAGGCPTDETLVRLIEGRLDEARMRGLRAHGDACAACARTLVELAHTLAPAEPDEWLGERYRLLAPLGAGGMGVVAAAFDTQLQRKVAVKRLRETGGDAQVERRRARFLREARLLASLSHPNVLTIHDVGGMDRELYVVMELVDGWPMSRWISESRPRPGWREIVDRYLQAGRGLAAAHALDVVHRDVKPENILVARSGRVLIGDFGLAGLTEARGAPAPRLPAGATLTETGAVLGTPAYMAPELHDGAPGDARSDQFSFCTSLWESLHGRRPFSGQTAEELVAATRRGPPAPGADGVPRALDRVVARGLAADPRRRHPSMSALLDELARARDRRELRDTPRWALVAAGALLAAAGGAVALGGSAAPPAPTPTLARAVAPSRGLPATGQPAPSFESAAPEEAAPARVDDAPPAVIAAAFGPAVPPRLGLGGARPAPARRAAAAHKRVVALAPGDADPSVLLTLADGAHDDRDGASCLTALGRVPAGAWPADLAERAARRRATCEMLRGRCDEGSRLLAAAEGEDAARAAVLADCPVAALPALEDRLRAVVEQADEARYAGNAPKRRVELARLLARQTDAREMQACLRREPGARACGRRLDLLARAYQVVAESFLLGGDCAEGAALDVMHTEVQLESTAPSDGDRSVGCRADRTRDIYRACSGAAAEAERRCVARVQSARHDGFAPVPEPPR
jgi:tRNA A-37 threonylcarbamoyl transferase component Bud32